MKECKGRIHSIESMGLVDGPGIRTVVFFQGCPLRCIYCHNPDTWNFNGGYEITAGKLVDKIMRFKPYFEKSNGGVTFSGGECLMQPNFLIAVLKLCKENGIHTAIDTSGYGLGEYDEILKYADLVILDIKHINDDGYRCITSKDKSKFNEFIKVVQNNGNKLWIRHVIVPEITDSKQNIVNLAEIIKSIKNVDKVELLPYHTLGVYKYEKLNIDYKLKGVEDFSKDKINHLKQILDKKLSSDT